MTLKTLLREYEKVSLLMADASRRTREASGEDKMANAAEWFTLAVHRARLYETIVSMTRTENSN